MTLSKTYDGLKHELDNNVIRMKNTGLFVEGKGRPDDAIGAQIIFDPDTNIAEFRGYDHSSTDDIKTRYRGKPVSILSDNGVIRMDEQGADLRLATGQAIEDGDGTSRLKFQSFSTFISDSAGNVAIDLNDGSYNRIKAFSGTPLEIYDDEGSFTAGQYTTSASAPGTLELTNAELISNNQIKKDGDEEYVILNTVSDNNSVPYSSRSWVEMKSSTSGGAGSLGYISYIEADEGGANGGSLYFSAQVDESNPVDFEQSGIPSDFTTSIDGSGNFTTEGKISTTGGFNSIESGHILGTLGGGDNGEGAVSFGATSSSAPRIQLINGELSAVDGDGNKTTLT